MLDRQLAVNELAVHILGALRITATREFRFHPKRRWRFDLALVAAQIGIEVDGGVHTGGRHVRGKGYEEDLRKIGEALVLGWIVVRATPAHVATGEAVRWVEAAVRLRAAIA